MKKLLTLKVYPFTVILIHTDGLFDCYVLEESICHFRGVNSILLLLFYF